MQKIPDFIVNGSATLVSSWVTTKESGFSDYVKMIEFCGANGIKPPMCMALLSANIISGTKDNDCFEYCEWACKTFNLCADDKQKSLVCKIYGARMTSSVQGYVYFDYRIHTIASACLKEKIPRKVRDFANKPSSAGLDGAFEAARRA